MWSPAPNMPNGRDGTTPSPTPATAPARGPNIAAGPPQAVGATPMVARAGHAVRCGTASPSPTPAAAPVRGAEHGGGYAASRRGDPCGRPCRTRRTVRDGTSPSPTPAAAPARGPNIAADTRAVGATLVVARAGHAVRWRDGTSPSPTRTSWRPPGPRTSRRVRRGPWGDPCGRPRQLACGLGRFPRECGAFSTRARRARRDGTSPSPTGQKCETPPSMAMVSPVW